MRAFVSGNDFKFIDQKHGYFFLGHISRWTAPAANIYMPAPGAPLPLPTVPMAALTQPVPAAPHTLCRIIRNIHMHRPEGPYTMKFLDELAKCSHVDTFRMWACQWRRNTRLPRAIKQKWNRVARRCNAIYANGNYRRCGLRPGMLTDVAGDPTRFCIMRRNVGYPGAGVPGAGTRCCNRPGIRSKSLQITCSR